MTDKTHSATSKPTAIITGATRGIGRSIAIALAQEGYDIAFCYRSEHTKAQSLQQELNQIGAKTFSQQCDITDEQEVAQFYEGFSQDFNRLDLLVNNAGQTHDGLLATMSIEAMRSVLETNVIGTMLFCKQALTFMLPAKQGCIINLSSISASKPNKGQCNYAASKGAVEALTRALAVEVASKGIRVNAVAPGVIKTDMTEALMQNYEKTLKKRLLAKHLGEPDDIARAVGFLANPDNHYITGETLSVNGGLSLG